MGERVSETTLSERATAWLQQQPEYPVLFLADRRTRRRAAGMLADVFFTLPTTGPHTTNRKLRRQELADMKRVVGKVRTKMSRRQQRLLHDAMRQRARFGRMSVRRMEELADREARARQAELYAEERADTYSDEALAKAAADRELYEGGMESTDPALD